MPSQPSRPDAALASTLPHLFIDRSLGAIQLPAILRENGVSLTTLREHYGVPADQRVEDTAWISLTAERGWIGFHKDAAIRRNEVERLTVLATGARLFCIPRADRSAQAKRRAVRERPCGYRRRGEAGRAVHLFTTSSNDRAVALAATAPIRCERTGKNRMV